MGSLWYQSLLYRTSIELLSMLQDPYTKTLTKHILDTITFLLHNIKILEIIFKAVAIAKINDLI